jgi:hypothetical protein
MRPLALQAGLGSVVSVSTCPILVRGNPRPAQAENPLGALFKFARPPLHAMLLVS